MTPSDIAKRLEALDRALVRAYGNPKPLRGDPLEELIATILSQNTSDLNSGRAYDSLRAAFPTWEDVIRADPRDVERAIQSGGLAKTKSRRIQQILRAMAARGDLSLDLLRRLSPEAAENELVAFKGVGLKTARCVLLFALGKDVFPIDTHIERVLKRIGILPARMTPEQAHAYLPPWIPQGRCLALHLNLITHGRRICHARNPDCLNCRARSLCDFCKKVFPRL